MAAPKRKAPAKSRAKPKSSRARAKAPAKKAAPKKKAPAKKTGRPPKEITPAITETIVSAIIRGNNRKVSAGLAGISDTTLYRWLNPDETPGEEFAEFREKVRLADSQAEAEKVSALSRLAQGDEKKDVRPHFGAIRFWLRCRNPEDWNDRPPREFHHEHSHTGTINVQTERVLEEVYGEGSGEDAIDAEYEETAALP